jgi:hypothetical protein
VTATPSPVDEFTGELLEALRAELLAQPAIGVLTEPIASFTARLLAEGAVRRMRARGRLQWRPTKPCCSCTHTAERTSDVGDWSCGDFCCSCARSGGCKVEA